MTIRPSGPIRHTGLYWWIDRWRISPAFIDMNLEQQGAYRNLLDEMRLRGGTLPNDENILAVGCGDARRWPTVRGVVMSQFILTPNGWCQTERLTSGAPWPPRSIVARLRRPHIPLWIQRLVRARDGTCRFCGSGDRPELDHVIRRRDGGSDTVDNLIRILCRPCNRSRG
jgi:hypothetical protein